MAFTLSSIDRERVPENGGHELRINGAFEVGSSYSVYVGINGSTADDLCYSGKPGQGNVVYPWTASIIRCYTPILSPDANLSVTVKNLGTAETHTLSDVLVADYQYYHSTVFGLRKVFPPFYKMGPKEAGQVGAAAEIAPSFYSDQTAALNTTTVKVAVPAGNSVTMYWGDGTTAPIVCDGTLKTLTHDYATQEIFGIYFTGNYDELTQLDLSAQTWLGGVISSFSEMVDLTTLYLQGTTFSGNLSNVSGMSGLVNLNLSGLSLTGTIANLVLMTSMVDLQLQATSVTGDIVNLAGMTSATVLRLSTTSVTGDITNLSGMTSLTILDLATTAVSGNISNLAAMTSMVNLQIQSTSVSGDMTNFSGMTALAILYAFSTSCDDYTTGALPAWANADIQINDVACDSMEVDDFLIDLANGVGANGSIDISGTNGARTILSDAAVATLVAAGWSVTANEPVLCSDQVSGLNTTTVKLIVPGGNALTVHWGDNNSDVVTCDGTLQTLNHDYGSLGYYGLWFEGDANQITELQSLNQAWIDGTLEDVAVLTSLEKLVLYTTSITGSLADISGLTSMTWLSLYNTALTGSISNLSGMTSMARLYLGDTAVTGDISNLSGLTGITYLYLYNTSVTGNIINFSGMTSLTRLSFYDTSVSGNISNLSGLISLTYLHFYNTSVTGDITSLSGLTSLIQLQLYSTAVIGDLTDLAGLTSLTVMHLYSTSCDQYTTGALPPWANNDIQIYSIGLNSDEVDDFIIDLASGVGVNGTLNIAGTNAARTIASDAAKAVLVAAGWSVTANESVLSSNQISGLNTTTIKLTVPGGNAVTIHWGDNNNDVVTCDGTLKTVTHDYAGLGYYGIWLEGDYDQVTQFQVYSQAWIEGDLADVSILVALTDLRLYDTTVTGDIADLSGLTSLTYLDLNLISISGDIANLSGMTSLTRLGLNGTSVSGNISNLSGMTSMDRLYLGDTSVTGDIVNLAGMTSLTYLYLYNTTVSGNISNLSGMSGLLYLLLYDTSVSGALAGIAGLTSLDTLSLYNTSVSGDFTDVAALTSLNYLRIYNTSCDDYTTGALPAWAGTTVLIHDNGLDSMEVDDFIIDLSNGVGAGGTLQIDGTNAARTILSDAAVATLVGAGWSVTANEPVLCTDQTGGFNTVTTKFIIPGGNSLTIHWGDNTSTVVVCDGALNTYTHDYGSTGYYGIWFEGDYNAVTRLEAANQAWIEGDLADISILTALTWVNFSSTAISGNISSISGLTGLTSIRLYATNITGNLSSLSGMTSMAWLYLYNTSVTGDISNLSAMTSMTGMYLYNTTVSGNISNLVGMTSMVYLNLRDTSVTGDISNLSAMTSMQYLYLYNTTVLGDLTNLAGLTALKDTRLNNSSIDTYTTGALPAWAGNAIQIQDLDLDSAEVDDFIIDLASGVGASGTLNIGGTNAARTSNSDAALATLVGASWSVTVNEPVLLTDQVPSFNMVTIKVAVPGGNSVTLRWGDGATDAVVCDGTLKTLTHTYTGAELWGVDFTGDFDEITMLEVINQAWIEGDIANLAPLVDLIDLRLYSTSVSGDLSDIAGLTSITYLRLNTTSVVGDIVNLAGMTGLTTFYGYGISITGDLSDIAGLTSLTHFLVYNNPNITGNISNFSGMTNLTYLRMNNTAITGNISSFSGLTSFATMMLYNNLSLVGDLSSLAALTALNYVALFGTSCDAYTSGALPAWAGSRIYVYNTGLDSMEVDDFIIDLANGVGAGVDLKIGGTNAARTILSDAAVATIIAASGTVDANEPIVCSDQTGGLNTTSIQISVSGGALRIRWGDNTSEAVTCDGGLYTHTHDYGGLGYYGIWLDGDHGNVIQLRVVSQAWIDGDLADLSILTALISLHLYNTSVTGTLAGLSGLTSLTTILLQGTAITGTIASLAALTSMTYLSLTSLAGVTGDISNLTGMTGLNVLYAGGTGVTGNISSLAGLNFITLQLQVTAVTGDLTMLSSCTAGTGLYLYSSGCNQYTTGSLPAWAGTTIHIYSVGLDSTEVDNFLIDLANGVGSGGTLDIAGTNAVRTAASDAAIATLAAASWTVTVN